MSFDTLPTELYRAILDLVPFSELQHTVLAVTRAIPFSPIPLQYLFQSIRITHPDQAVSLYHHLRLRSRTQGADNNELESRSELQEIANWVEELSIESWTVDAEVVINIIRLLQMPRLRSLKIWIGPNNFAPENLEEFFSRPLLSLRHLSLRFRPYVQKATYYQFLKGAYFDSTLTALSRWPSIDLPTLSIIQDPLDSTIMENQKQTFAQPIVFFRLDLSSLFRSPALSSLTSLRLRIPSRPVVRSLCSGPLPLDILGSVPLPDIEFLDLSTSGVLDSEIDLLLVRFASLKHIVLDGCFILRGDLHERFWHALGKSCALAGVKRAKEREKSLKAWLELRNASESMGNDGAPGLGNVPRRIKRGRRGLATATISLRAPDPVVAPISRNSQPRPKDETSQLKKKHSKKTDKAFKPTTKAPITKPRIPASRIRVLPSLPTLMSLSVTLSSAVEPEIRSMIQAEFQEGWAEGVAQLAVTRARLRTSAGNGYRIMRVSTIGPEKEEQSTSGESSSSEDGLEDLEDVDRLDPDTFGMPQDTAGGVHATPPILCFAGPSKDGVHEDNCGHLVGWEVMRD